MPIFCAIRFGRCDGLRRQRFEGRRAAAEEVFLYFAVDAAAAHEVLYHAVFERVICDYGESSARAECVDALAKEALECLHFAVDGYAEGLENLRELFFAVRGTDETLGSGSEHSCGGDSSWHTLEGLRESSGLLELSVYFEDCGEGVGIGVGYQLGSGAASAGVHAHVERAVGAE